MKTFSTDFCSMELYPKYVILTVNEGVEFNLPKATIIRQKLSEIFKDKEFLMISNRKFKHTLPTEVYKKGQLSNMRGLAIVANTKEGREKALEEQKLYGKSFAFFTNLEDAKSWAENYFY